MRLPASSSAVRRRPLHRHRGYRLAIRVALAISLILVTARCKDSSAPGETPAALERVSGHEQSAAVATALAQPLIVRVVSSRGTGVRGVAVTWVVSEGGGTLSHASTRTDEQGETSVRLTLGTVAGSATNVVTATVARLAGAAAQFTATSTAGPAARLEVSDGNNQSAPAATALPIALAARVMDVHGNAAAGTSVQWTVGEGDGSVDVSTQQSDADGKVTAMWTLGRFARLQRVTVSAASVVGPPLAFQATATPNGTISGRVTMTAPVDPLFLARIGALAPGTSASQGALLSGGRMLSKGMRAGASVSSTSFTGAGRRPPALASDELIVTFEPNAVGAASRSSLARAGIAALQTASRAIGTRLAARERSGDVRVAGISPVLMSARVRVADPARVAAVAAGLRGEPGVARVDVNEHRWLRPSMALAAIAAPTSDFLYPFQAWNYEMIGAPAAWRTTRGSPSVIVAVVDDGIRFDHPDIAANLTTDGYDFVSNVRSLMTCSGPLDRTGDGDGYDPDPTIPRSYDFSFDDDCLVPARLGGHGLHVAGIVGAWGNNGMGVAGVNWNVRIRPIRVMDGAGSGTDYDVAQGILYAAGLPADNGAGGTVRAPTPAAIINLSLGSSGDAAVLRSAIAAASAAGSLIVAAAGNFGDSELFYPAAYDEVISVSAVDPTGGLADYSSFGSTVDIAAPGGGMAFCDFTIVSTSWNFDAGNGTYACASGTSAAAPHVAGVAALILASQPGLSAAELRSRLLSFATDVGAAGRDDRYGAGIVNARNSITRSLAPARSVFVELYDAATGIRRARVVADASGSYTFGALPDGDYRVHAGADADGDQMMGVPGRPWGAFGGAQPATVSVRGAGVYPAAFTIGFAAEREPNEALGGDDLLPVGGHLRGEITTLDDVDVFPVQVPAAARYTFETSAVAGACGFALEADTSIDLLDATGAVLASNRDTNASSYDFCASVSMTLAPGLHFVRVTGEWPGRYHVAARAMP